MEDLAKMGNNNKSNMQRLKEEGVKSQFETSPYRGFVGFGFTILFFSVVIVSIIKRFF